MKRKLVPTSGFRRSLKRLGKNNREVSQAIRRTLDQLEQDAFSPSLKAHKLQGNLADYRAVSAGYELRILFQLFMLEGEEAILLVSVGSHDDVY